MSGALLDTSVVIALARPGELDLPGSAAVSVVTMGELRAGVLLAPSAEARGVRRILGDAYCFDLSHL